MLLLLASYVFYFLAGASYLPYIFVTTVSTYLIARKINSLQNVVEAYIKEHKKDLSREERKEYKAKEKKKQWRLLLLCLFINIGILAVLKYTNFAISNVNSVLNGFGSSTRLEFVDFVLPMGISFYTFQSMGYLIDVYRGKYEAEKNPLKFALFVSFFPQLVQGPISRFDDLAKTLYEEHKFDATTVASGLQRILWGYFKKMVIADRMLVAVNTLIKGPEEYQGAYVFAGMLFYALELYADFTGGIDITIGIAEALGIRVTENFHRPYFSKNIKEYWNRWHITMGNWFTNYIFYPLSLTKSMQKLSKWGRAKLGVGIGKGLGKLGKSLGNIAGAGNRNGKVLLLRQGAAVELLHLIDLAEDALGIAHELLALGCEPHTLHRSVENGDAQVSLQLLDAAAQIRHRHKQLLRGLAQRSCARHLAGIFHVHDVQAHPSQLHLCVHIL